MANARRASVPKKTQADIKYMYYVHEWKAHRNSIASTDLEAAPDITQMENTTLQYWLSRFVLEVQKKDGSIYPANIFAVE